MQDDKITVDLRAQGKMWGVLRIIDGRLILECKRQSREVSFDLLASVEQRRAVTDKVQRVVKLVEQP